MATKQPQVKAKQPAAQASSTKQSAAQTPFIFDRTNYLIMTAGVVIILIGFALMSGGATSDPAAFPKEEIYSFRRITLAPIVIMIGFGIEIVAILKRPKTND
ncbi:MAG: DUF3098 domain-containing protein [Chitinophagales bacterium]